MRVVGAYLITAQVVLHVDHDRERAAVRGKYVLAIKLANMKRGHAGKIAESVFRRR